MLRAPSGSNSVTFIKFDLRGFTDRADFEGHFPELEKRLLYWQRRKIN
jgi:hypothetical protein